MNRPRVLAIVLVLLTCMLGAPLGANAATTASGASHHAVKTTPKVSWTGQRGETFDPKSGPAHVRFTVNENARVQIRVFRVHHKGPIYTMLFQHVKAGVAKTFVWTGKRSNGKPVPDGKYFFALRAVNSANDITHSRFGLLNVQPPAPVATATAAPTPAPAPATVPAAGRHIVISLSRQMLFAYTGTHLDIETYVTTGNPSLPTPTGSYSILNKQSPFEFISPWPVGSPYYYAPSLSNYAMLFRSGGYYIHDAPWRSAYGPGTNGAGTPGTNYGGTHGCVNVPYGAMVQLWDWTSIGTPVYVIP
jgi:lipoprotein-anchoring transpeptidase ErfK/SrfK